VEESIEKNRPKIRNPAIIAATIMTTSLLNPVQSNGQTLQHNSYGEIHRKGRPVIGEWNKRLIDIGPHCMNAEKRKKGAQMK
jgi:hypothetical protein